MHNRYKGKMDFLKKQEIWIKKQYFIKKREVEMWILSIKIERTDFPLYL